RRAGEVAPGADIGVVRRRQQRVGIAVVVGRLDLIQGRGDGGPKASGTVVAAWDTVAGSRGVGEVLPEYYWRAGVENVDARIFPTADDSVEDLAARALRRAEELPASSEWELIVVVEGDPVRHIL